MTASGRQLGRASGLHAGLATGLRFLGLACVVFATACNNDVSADNRKASQAAQESTVDRGDGQQALGSDQRNIAAPIAERAPMPTGPLPPDANCISAECHATFATARQVHGPIASGDCTVCHGPDQGDHKYPIKRQGNETCTFCHPTSGNLKYRHAAPEVQECIACHRPHVSDAKFLLTAESVQDLCLRCHISVPKTYPHGPFATGECTACHEPHESAYGKLLRGGDGQAHCFMCHDETGYVVTNATYVHDPTEKGCTICHSPHSSDHEHALRQSIEQTCFSCHADLERHIAGSSAAHAAVFTDLRCANCHDVHASGRPKLLRARQDVLCLQCHDQPIQTADGRTMTGMGPLLSERLYLHGPVETGDCTACHNVHGSRIARLLREQFTEAFYATFDLSNYALCFRCHERTLVTEERTTSVTAFRSGNLNLHFLHVNRQRKGRTCRTCHTIHASDAPKLIADTVPFDGSGWAMPIGFKKTDVGGSCAPGCHEPLSYSRNENIVRPQRTLKRDAP